MSYKTIVVHLDCGERRTERLDLAIRMALEFEAHLIGLFALDLIHAPAEPEVLPIILETERTRRDACAVQAEQEFQYRTSRHGLANATWRSSEGDAVGVVCFTAHHADLVIIGQQDPKTFDLDGLPLGFAADVVLSAGKPVLVVPYAGHFTELGKRTMVAWNEAREAARAVTDALPMLRLSQAVDVVTFDRAGKRDELPDLAKADTLHYLGRHGVTNAKFSRQVSDGIEVGDLILSRAADEAADTIVMGAYGHSRLRETILGGATRTVLKSMTVPVLMSH